ncbi:unnamed protein product [Rhizoctonia solani]|uniref:BTB domain-containing protein n=3 Tax=Rhizoctonia solani TaxID=456999 RepID=A0A8H3CWZ5_9AGAM|nr:BTB domain protein, putative [Rhizoctonia solani AG-3 Rhs1AP]KEP51287.1 putative BTB domain protein [Rhizoctonia solani 123E]CAE6456205.1 unnamed protein product [Rhizoctonia solani]CAE6502934.1 unnamed protein product [Rhizoctonia solani]
MDFNKYTVSLQGKEFVLDRSQIDFEGPNYFTACFLGSFKEAQTRRVELNRDPDIFRIILSYLSGYSVLPLTKRTIPESMTPGNALKNLRVDAAFYQLGTLVDECDRHLGNRTDPDTKFLILGATSYHSLDYLDEFEPGDIIDDPLVRLPVKSSWQTYVAKERLDRDPFDKMTTPKSAIGSKGLRMTALVEAFVSKSIAKDRPLNWRLFGWVSHEGSTGAHLTSELTVVVEDLGRTQGSDE